MARGVGAVESVGINFVMNVGVRPCASFAEYGGTLSDAEVIMCHEATPTARKGVMAYR